MLSPLRRLLAWLTAVAIALGLCLMPATSASADNQYWMPGPGVESPKGGAPDFYTPPTGVRFNDPFNRVHGRSAIRQHILRTIDSVPAGGIMQMSAWNIRGRNFVNALIRAHKRGVGVQIVMDRGNWNASHPNPEVADLSRVLAGTERGRKYQSFLKLCAGSCRGARGIPHSKFFLFSKAGNARKIVIFGSNNATDVAANQQWNDVYTWTNRDEIYAKFVQVFNQMKRDRNVGAQGFQRLVINSAQTVEFFPYVGPVPQVVPDPDMARLNRVQCQGATGGAGTNGRTKIRVAQTAIHGDRGERLANKLVKLRRAGCDIRIVYALMGDRVKGILTRGGVGLSKYAYDGDENGVYEIYLHMKAMAISGNYNGVSNERIVWNGSANWSAVPLASDEVVGQFDSGPLTNKYISWIDYLYTHRPGHWRVGRMTIGSTEDRTEDIARQRGVDPYSFMKEQGL
ncbi:phospholipase D-like domain-containing protein [Nocardioides caeni]|nr:phospholipase D-like domain-containing protein [Nocardioides caeni]